ncbi:type II 3-dehydroquinate dehydratase [Kiloniella sp. EL199]|uniref:type II 3-dehydroquinate dehydratase n=1 Tax=Kiloniella sp. EL199 TaxID=2107581 RepID=UPI000EA2FF85|nr:type II 3-dehydroquinate dehydratase [Kiloniella sp. EL199]
MPLPSVLLLNGPNLNLLGSREPEIYGPETLEDLNMLCHKRAKALGVSLVCQQSNWEGQLIDWIHNARGVHEGIIINPGALTHTSIGLLDALKGVDLPVIEVHISNIHRRESFRHQSYVSQAALGVICGLGRQGYLLAIDAIANVLNSEQDL